MIVRVISLVLIISCLSVWDADAKTQVPLLDTNKTVELPADSLLNITILDRLRFGCGNGDYNNFMQSPGSTVIGRLDSPMGRNTNAHRLSFDELIHVLAWQKSVVPKKYVFNKKDLVLYNTLVWCSYKDSSGAPGWALMVVTKDENLGGSSWKLVCDGATETIRRYSTAPTGKDVAIFLQHLSTIEQHLFVGVSEKTNEDYGVPLKFLDGNILDETWEAVIGEKPTKFFPNGK